MLAMMRLLSPGIGSSISRVANSRVTNTLAPNPRMRPGRLADSTTQELKERLRINSRHTANAHSRPTISSPRWRGSIARHSSRSASRTSRQIIDPQSAAVRDSRITLLGYCGASSGWLTSTQFTQKGRNQAPGAISASRRSRAARPAAVPGAGFAPLIERQTHQENTHAPLPSCNNCLPHPPVRARVGRHYLHLHRQRLHLCCLTLYRQRFRYRIVHRGLAAGRQLRRSQLYVLQLLGWPGDYHESRSEEQ